MNLTRTTRLSLFLLFSILYSTSFVAQENNALDIALRHLQQERENLKLSSDDIQQLRVSDLYSSKHNGVTHVYLIQQNNQIDIDNAIININVMPDGSILNMGNRFLANIRSRVTGNLSITAEEALKAAMNIYAIPISNDIQLKKRIDDRNYIFSSQGISLDDVPVKAIYIPMDDKSVRLCWNVEIQEMDGTHWWSTNIDAETGDLVSHRDMIIRCSFGDGFCVGPEHKAHKVHHDTRVEQKSESSNSGLANSYFVLPVPVESPNHGTHELVVNPADPIASPFGWHDTNGLEGAEFTITRGNNVHAYHDIFALNTSLGTEPDGGENLDFNFPFDPENINPYQQVDAATTNLFYWNNITHDVWYHYGFDEPAGNFQANNYGKGGEQGDYVRAEALDGGGVNNANFGTGGDGSPGRMQMFIWTNQGLPPREVPPLQVEDLDGNVTEYEITPAAFGDPLPIAPIIAPVVLADDGIDITTDACQDLVNAADFPGKIAIIDRNECEFGEKVLKAEQAGAIAVIVCNNVPGDNLTMGAGAVGNQVTIPSAMISLADCDEIKLNLDAIKTFRIQGSFQVPDPGPEGIDGDFDNGIIVHEYVHGISLRLTGGPSTAGCLQNFEQAGEGWSDWFAIAMTTDASNFAEERRGVGTYAVGQPIDGRGIRSFPYTRDMSINPHTFTNINTESVPHGVGSVFAAMMWDLYWNLVDKHGFDEDLVNGTGGNNIAMQLILDGLKLQPCNPTFVDARNAIISADFANNQGENLCLIWETFARRGLGKDAQDGGAESFEVADACNMNLKIRKSAAAEVDAGENIAYSILIDNDFPEPLTNVVVTDKIPEGTTYVDGSATCPESTFADGIITIEVGDLEVGETRICNYLLKVDPSLASSVVFSDDAEDGTGAWNIESQIGFATWMLDDNSFNGANAFFAEDTEGQSDQLMTIAEPLFIESETQVLSFYHSYNTERNWDGGVVELSTDGNNWIDLGDKMVKNGYDGPIEVNPASPISGRDAFHGNSNGYIQTLIEVGDWVGQEVYIRFRMACDEFVGADGWYVDNVQLFGSFNSITNQACVSSDLGENVCSFISSTVTGDGTSSTYEVADDNTFKVYPNPSDGKIEVDLNFDINQPIRFKVMSMDGKMHYTSTRPESTRNHSIDLSDLGKGMYILFLETGDKTYVKKIVLQ